MSRLTYIHDTLYFDDKPVNELNYTERGQFADYVNNLPDEVDDDAIDRDDVISIADKLNKLADELKAL